MMWLIFTLIAAFFFTIANMIDNYFANHIFKNTHVLIFYVSLLNLLFIPIVFLFQIPELPTLAQLPLLIILGLENTLYLYPYYKALQSDDTSTVVSLFSIGKMFVPLLAFFIVGEILTSIQYVGFAIIILASTFLTWKGKIQFNKSLGYMIMTSLLIAIGIVTYKYLYTTATWSTGFVWATIFSFLVALPLLLISTIRKQINVQFPQFKKNIKLFVAEEFVTFLGLATFTYALTLQKVSIVEAVVSIQPFIVIVITIIARQYWPTIFKEDITAKVLAKKSILFIIMIVGVYLVLR